VSRWELLEVVRQTKGFVSLSMSEPLKAQDFERYAWISYDSDENCAHAKQFLESQALMMIKDYRLNPVHSRSIRKNIMITPELPNDCNERDLELCKRLISEVFDPEKEIPPYIFEKIEDYAKENLQEV
jgi:hypothetical protein